MYFSNYTQQVLERQIAIWFRESNAAGHSHSKVSIFNFFVRNHFACLKIEWQEAVLGVVLL
jgi:hypothetical protein